MLKVWADGVLSGRLDRVGSDPRRCAFAYDPAARPSEAVSLTMPLKLAGYEYPDGLHPVFQMNLPEGRLRAVLERRFRKTVPGFDDLALLKIVGPAQIGRLRYGEESANAGGTQPMQSVAEILAYGGAEDLFADLVERFATSSGVSGVQPKVLVRDERAWSLSGDGRRSLTVRGATHIVKTWEADEFPELAANEYFCLQVALRAGLPVPAHALSDNGRFLVVERFDLDETGRYLGFEDACVLQGLPVAAKYDASYEALAKTLACFVSPGQRLQTLAHLFRLLAVCCALRNGDAHLKNFGVVYEAPDHPVGCAPAYDIVTTQVYLPRDVMALTLDGRKSWPSAKVMLQFAQRHCGLSGAQAREILSEVADAVADVGAGMLVEAGMRGGFGPIAQAMRQVWDQGVTRSLVE